MCVCTSNTVMESHYFVCWELRCMGMFSACTTVYLTILWVKKFNCIYWVMQWIQIQVSRHTNKSYFWYFLLFQFVLYDKYKIYYLNISVNEIKKKQFSKQQFLHSITGNILLEYRININTNKKGSWHVTRTIQSKFTTLCDVTTGIIWLAALILW